MNAKFLWQSLTDLRLFVLGLLLVVAAGATSVSALIWPAILFSELRPGLVPGVLSVTIGLARSYFEAAKLVRKGLLSEAVDRIGVIRNGVRTMRGAGRPVWLCGIWLNPAG